MNVLQKFVGSLLSLGVKRLVLLGLVFSVIFAMVLLSVYSFRQPVRSVLYSGLDKADVSAIGTALSEVGTPFDVNEAGDSVLVEFGKTAQARMFLAERGLPKSDKSGYELFDQMGSLGLTSFMQQITKVRALEGELVRTILQFDGIKSARVHLGLKQDGILRNRESRPTASVVIRVDGSPREGMSSSIRHLVAAAIPGLQPEQVMVSTTDGKLLAGPKTSEDSSVGVLLDLEKKVSEEITKRVENTLEPFAGSDNIRVSVSATINLDKRQVSETKFDPDSKVERSLQSMKSVDSSKDAGTAPAVSVDQNIPQEVKPTGAVETGSKKKEDKQETINFEIDSRQTSTTSAGYIVERLAVAVVVNKKAISGGLANATDEKELEKRFSEIVEIVKSSAGVSESRGDSVKVSVIDFYSSEIAPDMASELGVGDYFAGNLGTIINAASLIISILVVLLLGLRPALRILLENTQEEAGSIALPGMENSGVLTAPTGTNFEMGSANSADFGAATASSEESPKDQLNRLVTVDVDRAAQVLKKWMNEPERNVA
jgi:flagellar M-ring protein FliF